MLVFTSLGLSDICGCININYIYINFISININGGYNYLCGGGSNNGGCVIDSPCISDGVYLIGKLY